MGEDDVTARAGQFSTTVLLLAALLSGLTWGCSKSSRDAGRQEPTPQSPAEHQAAERLRDIETIERIAGELLFLRPSHVISGQGIWHPEFGPPEEIDAYNQLVADLSSMHVDTDVLISLLAHESPKVRTIAVLMLSKKGPSVLPHIVELLTDMAPTFPLPARGSSTSGSPPAKALTAGGLTVGHIAMLALDRYLGPAGYPSMTRGYYRATFSSYWTTHKDLPYCASWFAVRLTGGHNSGMPPSPKYVDDVRRTRRDIDAIPTNDRIWILLWLHGGPGGHLLVSEAELVELCKELGPDTLLQMLRHDIPSDDPDLQPGYANYPYYNNMITFVLKHAEELLRPSDAEALLACEQWHRDVATPRTALVTPWWAIAAATLQPSDAAGILRDAMERFQRPKDQATLAQALRNIGGGTLPD